MKHNQSNLLIRTFINILYDTFKLGLTQQQPEHSGPRKPKGFAAKRKKTSREKKKFHRQLKKIRKQRGK